MKHLIGMQQAGKRKRILVICPHPVGYVPGQRLKYEQYFDHWRNNGYDVDVSPFMSEGMQRIVYKKGHWLQKILGVLGGYACRMRDLTRLGKYDLVYVFLWVTPFGMPVFEAIVCAFSKKIVYDIDDLVFLKNIRHENRWLAAVKGKKKPIYMMKHALHVITCTPYLNEIAQQYNPATTDISSSINTDTYQPVNPYSNTKPLVLGWSGSHSTSQYLYLLSDMLKDLSASLDFTLLVIGDKDFYIEGVKISAHAWSEENEIRLLQQMDIGLYPLPLNEEWVLGKSGLKALQYMALGIPAIATAVGCNSRIIEHNGNGFLVTTPAEWKQCILLLAGDAPLRKQMGKAAREKVEQAYSVRVTAPTYLRILDEVAAL